MFAENMKRNTFVNSSDRLSYYLAPNMITLFSKQMKSAAVYLGKVSRKKMKKNQWKKVDIFHEEFFMTRNDLNIQRNTIPKRTNTP